VPYFPVFGLTILINTKIFAVGPKVIKVMARIGLFHRFFCFFNRTECDPPQKRPVLHVVSLFSSLYSHHGWANLNLTIGADMLSNIFCRNTSLGCLEEHMRWPQRLPHIVLLHEVVMFFRALFCCIFFPSLIPRSTAKDQLAQSHILQMYLFEVCVCMCVWETWHNVCKWTPSTNQ